MGGTYDSRNVIRVNVAMHAFLHKCLWEQHGRPEDKRAWRFLTSMIGREEAVRAMMSERMKGNTQGLGYHHTTEHRAKLSARMKGNTFGLGRHYARSAEYIAKHIGKKHTPETIAKLKDRVVSAETRAKISAAARNRPKGIKRSAETCAKMSVGLQGLKRSPDTCARIRAAAIAREQRKRDSRVH